LKKKYSRLDKLQIVLALSAAVVGFFSWNNDTSQWMFKLLNILIGLYLIAFGIESLREKRSFSSYFIMSIATLIIVLSLF
jgi:threonine/homoserine/homoserine lactone efflux protein